MVCIWKQLRIVLTFFSSYLFVKCTFLRGSISIIIAQQYNDDMENYYLWNGNLRNGKSMYNVTYVSCLDFCILTSICLKKY